MKISRRLWVYGRLAVAKFQKIVPSQATRTCLIEIKTFTAGFQDFPSETHEATDQARL